MGRGAPIRASMGPEQGRGGVNGVDGGRRAVLVEWEARGRPPHEEEEGGAERPHVSYARPPRRRLRMRLT